MKVVYYSIAITFWDPTYILLAQLKESFATLRAFNRSVTVILFVYGTLPEDFVLAIKAYDVNMYQCGPYNQHIRELAPVSWRSLSLHPCLHKFSNLSIIQELQPSQVLYIDCDTLFLGDVDQLFELYASAHLYAREEPFCKRSSYGYDQPYLDESVLRSVVITEGATFIPPFNAGVVMLNHGIWEALASLERTFIDYVWRFLVWMALHPRPDSQDSLPAIAIRENPHTAATASDHFKALPYPSTNQWIVDEVALWLTIGQIPECRYDDFTERDVLQNGEFTKLARPQCRAVLCHYYSANVRLMHSWLEG